MSPAEIEKRLVALERTVKTLKSQVARASNTHRRWWVENAGRFADDQLFEEIVRLGREYREALRPPKPRRQK